MISKRVFKIPPGYNGLFVDFKNTLFWPKFIPIKMKRSIKKYFLDAQAIWMDINLLIMHRCPSLVSSMGGYNLRHSNGEWDVLHYKSPRTPEQFAKDVEFLNNTLGLKYTYDKQEKR
jgi:hypothetical protein